MSTAPRQKTTWLSQMYDKVAVVVMLLVLLGSALILIFQIGSVRRQLTQGQWDQAPSAPRLAKPVDLGTYKASLENLARPFQMPQRTHRLMISEVRVSCVRCQKPIPFNAAVCPFCNAEQPVVIPIDKLDTDADGIPDFWESKYGLNPSDRGDAQGDLDGDGFSNVEEFNAETDPTNAKDFPDLAAKLRLRRVITEPFFLRFQAVNEISAGVFQYQLNLRTLERTYFAKIGEDVQGFTVVEYLPNAEKGPTVVLQQGEKKISLVKGQAVREEELTAQMVFLLDRTTMRARKGDIITLKGQEYKVVDIKRSSVLIRDVKTDKETVVPLLTAGDLATSGGG
ncbi:MAG: thrombospondin type 3 repeat-containing protein, partial [Verrucomicrobia bacterium]|nr:thrombospondin type 3 repeat-containing protein [Verrucomicrobiota bacterium]